jgi:hypothetical protein
MHSRKTHNESPDQEKLPLGARVTLVLIFAVILGFPFMVALEAFLNLVR